MKQKAQTIHAAAPTHLDLEERPRPGEPRSIDVLGATEMLPVAGLLEHGSAHPVLLLGPVRLDAPDHGLAALLRQADVELAALVVRILIMGDRGARRVAHQDATLSVGLELPAHRQEVAALRVQLQVVLDYVLAHVEPGVLGRQVLVDHAADDLLG